MMPSPAARKLRTDAARNRDQILDAATALFAERGDATQMADVARAAGVGIGTVYRHFPARRALIEAAAERRFAEILSYARCTSLPNPDVRQALAGLLRRIAEVHERGRALSSAIESVIGDTGSHGETRAEFDDLAGQLLARGRADGSIRADATAADLYMIVGAVAAVSRDGFGDWSRFIELALDGLRPPDCPRALPRSATS
jgi:AcrR family transcriptional regulator